LTYATKRSNTHGFCKKSRHWQG